ncbi:hypothetical protein HDV63DRAFT_59792 [Trichoderma sp. SZMC 28014]
MRFQSALSIVSLEPRALPTSESAQLPPPAAESTTQAATAPVFTYVTPPAPSNQSLDSVPKGDSNSGFTPPIQGGVSLGVCFVLLVGGLLLYRYNKWRSNKRSKANQDSTPTPSDPNPSMSEPPTHLSSRQREKMPASNDAFQTAVDDDEIRPVAPQKAFLASKKGGQVDDDSSSLVISPC